MQIKTGNLRHAPVVLFIDRMVTNCLIHFRIIIQYEANFRKIQQKPPVSLSISHFLILLHLDFPFILPCHKRKKENENERELCISQQQRRSYSVSVSKPYHSFQSTVFFRNTYTSVKKWDHGYWVVIAKYTHRKTPEEEYIDLKPILKNLYISPAQFPEPIKEVQLENA